MLVAGQPKSRSATTGRRNHSAEATVVKVPPDSGWLWPATSRVVPDAMPRGMRSVRASCGPSKYQVVVPLDGVRVKRRPV